MRGKDLANVIERIVGEFRLMGHDGVDSVREDNLKLLIETLVALSKEVIEIDSHLVDDFVVEILSIFEDKIIDNNLTISEKLITHILLLGAIE